MGAPTLGSGMDKLLMFPGKSDRGIFTYAIDHERRYLEKTAAEYHPTISRYINEARPLPGITQILLTALGAYEFWGDNANGDAFEEKYLAPERPDWGHKTFETLAKIYKHHVNKDPTASFGDVALAVYNPAYRRVELIVLLKNERAPDIVKMMDNGDYPSWSMGCLKKTAPILMKTLEKKQVSELKSGDEIINGMGGVSVVDYAHNHHHQGTWYHVSALGMKNASIEPTTEEHPWLVIPAGEVKCAGNPNNKSRTISLCLPNHDQKKCCSNCPNAKASYEKVWKRADHLEVGDYVATPILQGFSEKPEDSLAYLTGIYLAQGHITSDNYIELSVNVNDGHVFDKLCELFTGTSVKWSLRKDCAQAAKINIYDKDLASKVVELAGRRSHMKTLSKDVMLWPIESQKIMLGGYCDGDGGVYENAVYYSTCNKNLADQIQAVLLRVGCISSINVNLHKPSTVVDKDTVEYQIWIGRDTAINLKDYSFKTRELTGPTKIVKNHRFIYDGHLWSPIIGIETETCDEEVYNIAVRSDDYHTDSYVVNGVALHNCRVPYDICSICGNKAPNRSHYCEHLRYGIGRIDGETGKKAFAFNPFPKFFDISQVLIGADRIAKTLQKVASAPTLPKISSAYLAEKSAEGLHLGSGKIAEVKRADIEKQIPLDVPPESEQTLRDLAMGITEVKASEPPMPRELVDKMGGMDLPKVLATLASMFILPKPQEFQRIILISIGRKDMADDLERSNLCFDPEMSDGSDIPSITHGTPNLDNFDPVLFEDLKHIAPDRSYAAPHLSKRIVVMLKHGAHDAPLPRFIKNAADLEKERKPIGMLPALMAAAGLYAVFANQAPKEGLKGLDALIGKHPGLAAALGVGLVATFNQMAGPKQKGQFDQVEMQPNQDIFSRIEELKQKPYTKVAGIKTAIGPAASRLFLGIPATYMASGVLQKHRDVNPYEQEGRIKSFVRRSPDVISAALIADAMLSLRGKGTHGLLKGLSRSGAKPATAGYFAKAVNAVKGLAKTSSFAKTAEFSDMLSSSIIWPVVLGKSNLPARMASAVTEGLILEGGFRWAKNKNKNNNLGALS